MADLNKGKSKSQPKKYRRLSTKRMSDKPHITRVKKPSAMINQEGEE